MFARTEFRPWLLGTLPTRHATSLIGLIHYNPENKLIITVYTQDISVNLILLLPCLPQLAPCFLTVMFGTYIPSLPTLRFAAQVYQSAVRRNSPSKTWHSHLAKEVESGPRSDPCL